MSRANPAAGADPVDIKVGERLRQLRHHRGLSQEALAQGLGVSFQQVQKYERGANRISASMMWRAGKVLGVTAGSLFPEDGQPTPPPPSPLELAAREHYEHARMAGAVTKPWERLDEANPWDAAHLEQAFEAAKRKLEGL